MEENDGTRLHLDCDALRDLGGGEILPVQAVHVPLDGLHAHSADGGDDMVIVLAIGTADETWHDASELHDFFVADGDIFRDLLGAEAVVMIVGVRVVHDLVPCVHDRLHGIGVIVCPVAYHEKGGGGIVFLQHIQNFLRVVRAPCGVEGDGTAFFAVGLHTVNGKLSLGGGGGNGRRVPCGAENRSCRQQGDAKGHPFFLQQQDSHSRHSLYG